MQRKKVFYVLMLALLLMLFSVSTAFAAGDEGASLPAFTGTVFALSFIFVLGLGGIIIYGTSQSSLEPKKTSTTVKPVAAKGTRPQKVSSGKKELRKQLLAGKIDEKTYLNQVQKLQ